MDDEGLELLDVLLNTLGLAVGAFAIGLMVGYLIWGMP